MGKNDQYSKEIVEKIGKNMAKRLIKELENHEFKKYVLSEALECLKKDRAIYDDIGEALKKVFIEYLIDECVKQDNKEE